ncbi:MAG: DNA-directed RNA polymerase subunit omega [Myxococcales bacterium]|nr:DNA-directed RNA polymerase subunit omega [Myxococcales bacterium]|tara:strand:+ start:118 stop:354 length:237 start_codon:yes stop_codon:yes gene_type:complete
MARVTIEDCLDHSPSRFALAMLAGRRAYDLVHGSRPLVRSDNKEVVVALREVAAAKLDFDKELPSYNLRPSLTAESDE